MMAGDARFLRCSSTHHELWPVLLQYMLRSLGRQMSG